MREKEIKKLAVFLLFAISVATGWQSSAATEQIASKIYIDTIVTTVTTNIKTKADKKIPAVAGNIATLDAAGNLSDGGIGVGAMATDAELTTGLATKVSTSGDESVAGVKTFTSIPLIPTATLPSL